MLPNQPVTLQRDCMAILIPSGEATILPAGAEVRVAQALGGSYTVVTAIGYMARISDADADALGLEASAARQAADDEQPLQDRVWNVLGTCYDPEIPVNIVDLGLIYKCVVVSLAEGGHRVEVQMTLTAPGCGMGDVLAADIRRKLVGLRGVSQADIEVVFDPPWDRSRMSEAALLQLGLL